MKVNSAQSDWLATAICFLLLLLVIFASLLGPITTANYEVSDFAANGVLIQQAKTGWLLTGNYSRVGFNHPGPAILYVLAAGEFFLFDKLHIVPSPFSGQLVAVAAYNALWLAMIFRLLLSYAGGLRIGVAAFSTLITVFAICDHQIFNGIWFPHLYVLPFCALVLALGRLVTGEQGALPIAAVSTGFLINGHASFMPILFLLFVMCLAYLVITDRILGEEKLRKVLVAGSIRNLLTSLAIVFIFLLPLLIKTVTDFPGPLADYASFGGHRSANDTIKAIEFVAYYWGGTALFMAFILTVSVYSIFINRKNSRDITSALYVLIAATFCLFVYAKYGIDMLEETYIGEYYYSVPALYASMIVICLARFALCSTNLLGILGVVSAGMAVFISQVFQPNSYEGLYNDRRGLEIYEKLAPLKSGSRIVLDLVEDENWGDTWATIVGAQLVAARAGNNLFCINYGWHILFTKEARCMPEEIQTSQRYGVRHTNSNNVDPSVEHLDVAGFRFERWAPLQMVNRGPLLVSDNPNLFRYELLKSGWSVVERQFVWSVGHEATISIPVGKNFQGNVVLDIAAFVPLEDSFQSVTISTSDAASVTADLNHINPRQKIAVPAITQNKNDVQLKIILSNPTSPKELGISPDTRMLGVSLYGIEVVGSEN